MGTSNETVAVDQAFGKSFDFKSMSEKEIEQILRKHNIALTPEEALHVQNDILTRPPTMEECVLFSIQWSERVSNKSTHNFLKPFMTEAPNVLVGLKEDAGIVAVAKDKAGHRYGIVMHHAPHQTILQTLPFEGAALCVSANVQAVSSMGAEVIAVANSLRFGDIEQTTTQWISEGVVGGVAGYANPIGVPVIAGDVYYDEAYNEHSVVTTVALGMVRADHVIPSHAPLNADGFDLILVGRPTDNSGTDTVMQKPNPLLGGHLLKSHTALFQIFNEKSLQEKVGFKALGMGGIAYASLKLAVDGGYGADIFLDDVPTDADDLPSAVLMCSETQERYLWVVPPEVTPIILEHYNQTFDLPSVSKGAEAKVIGHIREDDQYHVYHQNRLVVDVTASTISKEIVSKRLIRPKVSRCSEPDVALPDDFNEVLLKLLSHENSASRVPIVENIDKQVQGRTVIEATAADAGVFQPFHCDRCPEEIWNVGVALSVDNNPRYNKIDPYWGAFNAVIGAARNVAAVGASPQAISTCFCFGNPDTPERMWEFSEAVRGITEVTKELCLKEYPMYSLPIVSSSVSLNHEASGSPIPATTVVSCLGKMDDVSHVITRDFKLPDSCILMLGERRDECGGSLYYQLMGYLGAHCPKPDINEVNRQIHALTDIICRGLILSAHDISEGGLAVAVSEMTMRNKIGAIIEIPSELPKDKLLFSESGGFVLEVARENLEAVEEIFGYYDCATFHIGFTTSAPRIQMQDCVDLSVIFARQAWKDGLREKLL